MLHDDHENNPILTGVIWKQLLIFFFPMLMGTFLQVLYNMIDAIVVGRYVGTEALAAVGGATNALINLVIGFFVGMSSGATVVISQFFGAGDKEKTSLAVHTAIALSLMGGAVIGLVGVTCARVALVLMGTPESVMPHALAYMRIFLGGSIFSLVYNMGAGILRARGDSKRPFYFLCLGVALNFFGDMAFVVYFGWGVAGVAWASILCQLLTAMGVLFCLMREHSACRLTLKKIRFHPLLLRNIIKIGLPTGFQSSLYSISNIVIQSAVNSFGVTVVAAWTILGKADSLYWQISNSFGLALSTFVGQNFGARKYDRVGESVKQCTFIAFGATIAFSAIFIPSTRYIYAVFTDDATVVEVGINLMWTLIPFYFTYVPIETLDAGMRGTGDTFMPTVMMAVGICGCRLVWIWCVMPFFNDYRMVGVSYPISWLVTSIAFVIYYRCSNWKRRSLVRAGHRHGAN